LSNLDSQDLFSPPPPSHYSLPITPSLPLKKQKRNNTKKKESIGKKKTIPAHKIGLFIIVVSFSFPFFF